MLPLCFVPWMDTELRAEQEGQQLRTPSEFVTWVAGAKGAVYEMPAVPQHWPKAEFFEVATEANKISY